MKKRWIGATLGLSLLLAGAEWAAAPPMGFPAATAAVPVGERRLIPAGTPFGVKMFTEGVMVVGMSDLEREGHTYNPAKAAGLRSGDIIITLNGAPMHYNEDVSAVIGKSGGKPVQVSFLRAGKKCETLLHPLATPLDGGYKAGMWVRDSSAGLGTMTYYDPETAAFGGLGHAICDADTGELMPLASGEAVEVTITGAQPGAVGFPGELHGVFSGRATIGRLEKNVPTGIYGTAERAPVRGTAIPIAQCEEITTGIATILTTIEGKTPQSYQVEILQLAEGRSQSTKNMVVQVIDPALLAATGGIVQGMSGSPILQNGKLIGAVTHVFVNDPTRGYGIFIENMLETAETAADNAA